MAKRGTYLGGSTIVKANSGYLREKSLPEKGEKPLKPPKLDPEYRKPKTVTLKRNGEETTIQVRAVNLTRKRVRKRMYK